MELAFRYFLPQSIDAGSTAGLGEILDATVDAKELLPSLPPRSSTTVPSVPNLLVRLFRHERMVSLPDLPFFYRYRLDVRSAV